MSQADIIAPLLKVNEKIIWQGKPVFWPFFLRSIGIFLFGFIWLAIPVAMFIGIYSSQSKEPDFMVYESVPFFLVIALISLVMFSMPLYYLLSYRFIAYVVTNFRIILVSGVVGQSARFQEFSKVVNTEVQVLLVDRLFSSGTIKFYTGDTQTNLSPKFERFIAISNPHKLFKLIQDAMDSHHANDKLNGKSL